MEDFEQQFTKVNYTLQKYGWALTPFIIGFEFQKIFKLVEEINANESPNFQEQEFFQNRLTLLLTDIIFTPNTRAFFVCRAKEVKHIQKFSHHLERAMLHYYDGDYFSTVLCLLPAVEGSLLSYYGWNFGNTRKPAISKLVSEVGKCREKTFNPRHYKMYGKILSEFLENWIFSDTSTADTTFSYLNRHYVLHGMGNNNYYSIMDANRLLMFFDLFIEFLSLEQRINYNFIPDPGKNISLDNRSDYYFKILTKNVTREEVLRTERAFMRENKYYTEEPNIPDFRLMMGRSVKEHIERMNELGIKVKKPSLYEIIKYILFKNKRSAK
ncbi:MAG: hypothetical protein QM710_14265 [Flavobacterium sp.]